MLVNVEILVSIKPHISVLTSIGQTALEALLLKLIYPQARPRSGGQQSNIMFFLCFFIFFIKVAHFSSAGFLVSPLS